MFNILLVEDEVSVGALINKSLRESGHTVSVAPDGNIGLEMAVKNEFDVLILDIMLPGINGLELCKRLRSNKIQTPILMLTGILGKIKNELFFITIYATVIAILHENQHITRISIPISIPTILGTVISLLLGFRSNQAYDRWWEAR